MMNTMKLPVGIDDFRKLRESDFYYVDKTRLIEQILQSWSEVTLFTRPRRFGKTLNMSMLKSFFEIGFVIVTSLELMSLSFTILLPPQSSIVSFP